MNLSHSKVIDNSKLYNFHTIAIRLLLHEQKRDAISSILKILSIFLSQFATLFNPNIRDCHIIKMCDDALERDI